MGLRVANIIEDGRYGGSQKRIAIVAELLKNEEIETIVILPKNDSEVFQDVLCKKKVRSIPVKLNRISRNVPMLIKYFFSFILELICLRKILKSEKVDIVHCNGSWQIKGAIAGKLAGASVIWHLNDTRRIKTIDILFTTVKRYFCDGFIFAAKKVEDFHLASEFLLNKPSFQIQAPVDTAFFTPDQFKVVKELSPGDFISIVTIGNINPAKGLEYFLEMAFLLNVRYVNLNFFIVGNRFRSQEKYSRKLDLIVRNNGARNIFFREGLNDVRNMLRSADIYVCSSIHEASPMSVWEAMSMGKSIVSTDVGDVSSYIRNGIDGFIVPPCNSHALAKQVEILIRNESLRKEFSSRVRTTAIESLDISICVKKHAKAYRHILAG
jgi:glycosyltransferase involved in cell wall biosynthesis